MSYTYKTIPAGVLRTIGRGWLGPFLQWLDALLTTLTGGGSGADGSWPAVRLATAGSLAAYTYSSTPQTLTFNSAGSQSVDGVATALNDRILNQNGAAASDNGIFVVTTKGTISVAEVWTRAPDANASAQFIPGRLVETGPDGTANNNNVYELTAAAPITLDTTSLTFGAPSNVVTTNTTQTVTGAKSFAQLALRLWNAGKTFAAQLTFAGTQNTQVTVPDVATMTMAQAGVNSASTTPGAGGATAPAFTGTAATAAENFAAPTFSGTGMTASGQNMTSTDNQTMTLNQCAGMWLICANHGPYMIASNTAVTNQPAVLTIYGGAPTTDAGTYKILSGMTPVGTVASHTHTGAAHVHSQT